MSRSERARDYFMQGYNCAQAVLLSFADVVDVDEESLLKIALPFGAGMGRLRLTCGAVSGMIMALGLITGESQIDGKKKSESYARAQELVKRFTDKNGSINCGELLSGKNLKPTTTPQAEERSEGYYKKRPCPDLCADATEILEGYLTETGYLK